MKDSFSQSLHQSFSSHPKTQKTKSFSWYKVFFGTLLVALLFVVYYKTLNPLVKENQKITDSIYFMNLVQNNIMQTVIFGKSHQVPQFDTLNLQINQLNKTLSTLLALPAIQANPSLKNAVIALIEKAHQQASYLESFKTTHAIKQISINFLPTAFGECYQNINKLPLANNADNIKLIQSSIISALKFKKESYKQSSYDLKQINNQIIKSGLAEPCKDFIHHNNVLTNYLSKEETLFLDIKTLDVSKDIQQFYLDFEQQHNKVMANNNAYYAIVSLLALLLIAFIALAFKKQLKVNQELIKNVQDLSQQQALFTTLIKLNRAIANVYEKHALFQAVCDITHTEAKFDSCWIGLIDDMGIVKPASVAGEGKEVIMGLELSVHSSESNSMLLEAFKTKLPVITNDFQTRLLNTRWAKAAQDWQIKGSATLPILLDDKVIGFFITYSKDNNFFTPEVSTLLKQFAKDLGMSLVKLQQEKEQKQHQQDLAISAIAFESHEAILITDVNNRIIRANKAFTKISGYSLTDSIGQTPNMLKSGLHDKDFYQDIWSHINKTGKWQGEIWNRKKDGTLYPTWQSISTLLDANHEVTHYISHSTDLTKDKESQREIHYLNNHDILTQLPNRNLLIDRLEQQLGQFQPNYSFLFLININRFKLFNESLGHTAGDDLLIQISKRLKELNFENIFSTSVSRLGNDEFALLCLSDINSSKEATLEAVNITNQIQGRFAQNFKIQNQKRVIDSSIGVTLFKPNEPNKPQKTPETLLQESNTALHRAKQSNLVAVQFFEESMQMESQKRLRLESDLHTALHNNEFILHFQPQYAIQSNQIIGVESLIRWQNNQQGLIPPSDFIPILEETGLINQVGKWILEESIAQAQILHKTHPHLTMSVNISAVQFNDKNLVNNIKAILEASHYPANKLELEITESLLMADIEDSIFKLNQLTGAGIKIAIDDFGTGYSSLAYLKQFPVNRLKIDKSFIDDILDLDDADCAIVKATIQMAQALHINTIAEGVEKQNQLDLLKIFGCDEVQGYLYSKPLAPNDLQQFLNPQPPS